MVQNITLQIDELHALLKAAGDGFDTPSLNKLFRFAKPLRSHTQQAPEIVLGRALGIPEAKLSQLSVAVYTAIADGMDLSSEYCMRADPVSLVAAASKVFLMGPGAYALSTAERQRLELSFKQQFAADGIRFRFPNNQRWYIQLPAALIPTELLPAPRSLLGGDIATAVSKLDAYWQRSFTEAQMLLHADPLRLQREQSGIPPLSGLWLWGGGQLVDDIELVAAGITCAGRSSLLQGLASSTGASWQDSIAGNTAQVTHWCAEQSGSAIEQLAELEQDVFQPLLQIVNSGGQIQLHSIDAGAWLISKSFRWPWQKRLTALDAIDRSQGI